MRSRLRTLLFPGRLQFTIATLLFVMLCAGGILTGFQVGYFWGVERRRDDTHFTRVYSVGDAIYVDAASQEPDFDTLLSALKATVDPASWSGVGGRGSIQIMATKPPLIVIAQSGKNHDAISTVLAELATARKKASSSP
jgi:hypothetical protein